jgi:predicted lipoprotein with Yx(FWY)xxD motif
MATTVMGAAVVAAGLLASACSTTSSSGSGPAAASGSASSTGSTGSTGSSAAATTVDTRSTSLGVVLVTPGGMTLYHRTDEHSGQVKCLADCTPTWPPYTVPAGTTPTGASGVTGLATTMRPDGTTQVTFNGQPLYRFSGDSSPGQTNGNGISGIWYAEKPAAASSGAGSGSSSSSSSSSSSGGYNYGGGY